MTIAHPHVPSAPRTAPARLAARSGVCSRARGFTLIELSMALLVTSVLVGAVGSLVVMTARAAQGSPKTQSTSGGAGDALARISAELATATTMANCTGTGLTFTIPDRTGDGNAETVVYSWAGSGSPLRRAENGRTAIDITGPLTNFALLYATTSTSEDQKTTSTATSAETLLSSFTGWTGITPTARELGLTASTWGTQYFKVDAVSLPATLTQLNITRVRVMLRAGTTGSVTAAIQSTGTGGQPSGTQVGSAATTPVASLGATQSWISMPLAGVTFTSNPTTGLNLVFKGTGTTSGYLRYLDSASAPSDTPQFLYSTTSGGTWLPSSSRTRYDAPFEVYGTYSYTIDNTVSVTTYRAKSVSVTVQSSGAGAPVTTTVRTLNLPVATGTDIEKP